MAKPDYHKWKDVDPLNVEQAAALLADVSPLPDLARTNDDVFREQQWLKTRLAEQGMIPANSTWPKAKQKVSRAQLKSVMEAAGRRPPFLYPDERTPSAVSTVKKEADAERWLANKVEAWKKGDTPRPKRDDLRDAALKQFGISRRAFETRIWPNVAPPEWRKPGPKS